MLHSLNYGYVLLIYYKPQKAADKNYLKSLLPSAPNNCTYRSQYLVYDLCITPLKIIKEIVTSSS